VAETRSAASRYSSRLVGALVISAGVFGLELVAGLASNSLALVADAGHVFADVVGMALSLGAIWLARRQRTDARTFGLYRLEIIAAAGNAVLLLGIAAFVLYEAFRRLAAPPDLEPRIVVLVAALALGANLWSLHVLSAGRNESLTVRGAYLEVAGDLLGAASVLVAGAVILFTGWRQADAVASILVALLIVPRTVGLLRDSIDILIEATPKGIDLSEVERHILEVPGVTEVHDLHAWTITSGMNVVSAHVVLAADAQPGDVLDHLGRCLAHDFDINHSTFQLETPEHVRWEAQSSQPQH
jgi:cobalt-zinc-cadmium efflux system protein